MSRESAPAWAGQALVIVPTYNERENIVRLVTELRALPGEVHVLVVDDNSTDGTGALVDEMAQNDAGVFVLHRPGKLGLGTAYKAGFDFGLACEYAYLCTMDADFSHSPSSLPALLDPASQPARTWRWAAAMCPAARWWAGQALRKLISHSANWAAYDSRRRHPRLYGWFPLLPEARWRPST